MHIIYEYFIIISVHQQVTSFLLTVSILLTILKNVQFFKIVRCDSVLINDVFSRSFYLYLKTKDNDITQKIILKKIYNFKITVSNYKNIEVRI